MEILIVDIETTGFITDVDAIVEIGIVLLNTDTREIKTLFDSPVRDSNFKPYSYRHKNAWIFNNSDLKIEDVIKADPLSSKLGEIQRLFNKYPVTAFNLAFDARFLASRGLKFTKIPCIMQSCKKYKIGKLDRRGVFGPPNVEEAYAELFPTEHYVEKHRGCDDALHEAKILLKLCDIKASNNNPKTITWGEAKLELITSSFNNGWTDVE